MPARRKASPEGEPTDISFESALAGLEAIVEEMEHEQLPLEELVSHYEKGSALLHRCEALLQSARERIELITLRNPSEIALESSPEVGQADQPTASLTDLSADSDDDDDIRLF